MFKNTKKFAPVLAAAALAVTCGLVGCSGGEAAAASTYTASDAAVTPGYEGDCWDCYVDALTLNPDGTYTMIDGDYILQQSGVIVTTKNTVYTGTYEKGEADAEGATQVTLSAPTSGSYIENGAAVSSEEDATILEDYAEQTVTVNDTTLAFTYAE